MRAIWAVIAAAGIVAGCDNGAPAGGRGYFDPPPPPQAYIPPSDFGQQAAGPRSALGTDTDPNAALARDVTATLQATGPGGAAPTGPVQSPAGQPLAPAGGVATAGGVVRAGDLVQGDIGIDPNDDSINLALSSQEVQKQQREIAEQRRQAAQSQLVVVQPTEVPQQDINANVVRFARETTHGVGTRRYNRPTFRDRLQSRRVCSRFDTTDEAQRQFLANGGPAVDRYNLDPDGDGFACTFDPDKYRRLQF